MVWTIILVIITALLLIFPFLPAIIEWKEKTDAGALEVNYEYPTIIEFYLNLFRKFIDENFTDILQEYAQKKQLHHGKLHNGIIYYVTGKPGLIELPADELKNKKTQRVILASQSIILPDDINFQSKIYAKGDLHSGKKDIIDALLAEGDVVLNPGTIIQRLVYSESSITIDKGCVLFGYAKAMQSIVILGNAKFQCLYAPRIEFGKISSSTIKKIPSKAINVFSSGIATKWCKKDLIIPKEDDINCHQVVKGNLTIGDGAKIRGNIKCHEILRIGNNVTITGALVGIKDIHIGDDCIIQGPIVTSGTIFIGRNCIIGTKGTPTTLVATDVQISSGSIFSGMFLAKMTGSYRE